MPIIDCPKCRKSLQLPDQYAGKLVQCPHCQQTFNAAPAAVSPAPLPPPAPPPQAVAVPAGPNAKDSREDEDDRQRPSRRPRRRFEDEGDDGEDDFGAGGRRPRRDQKPYRGAAVLTLGILSVVILMCGFIIGPIAWVMGHNDLKEMAAGRMDRSGEGITRAGEIIGMIGTIVSICIIGIYMVIILFVGLSAARVR
jgi:hypothetical protein